VKRHCRPKGSRRLYVISLPFAMSQRQRGVVLTESGQKRLEAAIASAQDREKYGKRFTQAELEERAGISRKTIKKIRQGSTSVDETSVQTFFQAFGLELETADYGLPELSAPVTDHDSPLPERASTAKIDWGEKPDTAIFFGRTEELATLGQWVMAQQCRVVTLLGMGGIGKTSLAAKLADQIYQQFDYVIWRSLREAPPLDEILVRLIQFLSDQQETEINLPSRLGERIIRLLHYLREHRCLLVLDNLESILQPESTGQFRDGYEDYGELIRRIGEAEHQSCLLLTSRECPRELAPMAGDRLPVRLCSISGIDAEAGREILKAKGLEVDEADTQGQELIRRYSGNPQALHLVATAIQREFLGDVDDFLEEEGAVVEDVWSLLDQHLTRLAALERSIFFWLAINREPVGLDELMEDLLPPVTKREVRGALRGLSDRYLIETVGKQFTLQNVIMEFASNRFIERVRQELQSQQLDLFNTHALIKATAKEYVRETQIRLVLKPIVDGLNQLDKQLATLQQIVRNQPQLSSGYSSGNLLNILGYFNFDIRSYDFSCSTIRQAYLKSKHLHSINFSDSHFVSLALTHTFSSVLSVAFSSDGQRVATGDASGNVSLWQVSDGKLSTIYRGHTDWVWSVAFSPDGTRLASGGEDQTIRLWDMNTHQCLHVLEGHVNWVWSVAFSPDGTRLASGGEDQTIRLWDVNTHQCLHVLEDHTDRVRSVAFSPDGTLLASGSADQTIRLWNVSTHQCLHVLEGHTNWVRSVAFNPDGIRLASSSADQTIRLWDVKTGQCLVIMVAPRPYEGTNITGAQGLTKAQRASMLALGAVDHSYENHHEN